jgi:G protein-coupled receptor Mth (Methuselah protein)
MPWSIGIMIFVAGISSFDYKIMRIFNILWPIFIFIIFVCKPSVWKMLKLKFPRMSPFFSTCEELGSKIICLKSEHQPLVTHEEKPSNSNNSYNTTGISGKFTQIGYQRHTETTV